MQSGYTPEYLLGSTGSQDAQARWNEEQKLGYQVSNLNLIFESPIIFLELSFY